MKKITSLLLMLVSVFVAMSCVDVDEYSDDPKGNFEALWKIVDER